MRKIRALLVLTFVVIVFIVPSRIQAANRGELLAAQGSEELDTYKDQQAQDGRFIPGDKGVVKDTKTGLEWFAGPDKDTTWDEAKAWTESLSVDGGGWRMPTRDEVKDLYTKGSGAHNVSPLFMTAGGFVWTGETVGSSHAWGFCLDIGDEYWPRRTYSETARGFAVRSGKR
ncbi:MAG: DUF1566 domain-containing protein [Desulfobacteria bacterium]